MAKRTEEPDLRTPCPVAGCGVLLDPKQLCIFHGVEGPPMAIKGKPRRHDWVYTQGLPAFSRRCRICGVRQRARDRAPKVKSKRAGAIVWEIITKLPNGLTVIGAAGPCPGPQKRRS